MSQLQKSALDHVACETEQIARPQAIQSSGALLLFDTDSRTLSVGSDNLEEYFGKPLSDLLGASTDQLFEPGDAQALDELMGSEKASSRYLQLRGKREHFVRVFETEGLLGVEINAWEDSAGDPVQLGLDLGNSLQLIVERAEHLIEPSDDDMKALAQSVADEFRAISGYDRSMVYRFDNDWNGEVIAESRSDAAPGSFLGLSFPSSDIPAQARALFLRNRVRPVVDIEQGEVPLLPALHPDTGKPVDLSDCSVRSVSPVHVEYLKNMGVRATLHIALVAQNKLWGLLSNHHYTAPYRLTPARAATCRLLAEVFSTELTRIQETSLAAAAKRVRMRLRDLRQSLFQGGPTASVGNLLAENADALLEVIGCDGFVVSINDRVYGFGDRPDDATIDALFERCGDQMTEGRSDTCSTHFAKGLWPELAQALGDTAAGVFACRYPDQSCRLMMFRNARSSEITWSGDPYKTVAAGPGQRLHRRKSFEEFNEKVSNRSLPWEDVMAAKAREFAMGLAELDLLSAWRQSEMQLAASRVQMECDALHDGLTDLPNRRYLKSILESVTDGMRPWSAVLHMVLDGFKQVNDTLGHAAGNTVLTEVASRLRGLLRDSDFCARIGGGEFVIVVGPSSGHGEIIRLGDTIVTAMAHPFVVAQRTCHIGASVGLVLDPEEPVKGETLLHWAGLALYEAKRAGRGRVTVYTSELDERMRRSRELGEEILSGVRGGQFMTWYQPQFDARTHALSGVEALLRWEHPNHGSLSPDRFVDIAEDTNHLATLDAISMERSLADFHAWKAAGIDVPKVSLNVSLNRLAEPDLIRSIRAANLPPEIFTFELRESIYLDEVPQAIEWNLDLLRDYGLRIEVDDFGTGRTSIVNLARLRPHSLKIDSQLVAPIIDFDASRKLVASIVEIGRSLNIGITAEGVETMEHAAVLRDLGCTQLQGFAFAKPMPSRDLMPFIRDLEKKIA